MFGDLKNDQMKNMDSFPKTLIDLIPTIFYLNGRIPLTVTQALKPILMGLILHQKEINGVRMNKSMT